MANKTKKNHKPEVANFGTVALHKSLPSNLSKDELAEWFKDNAIDDFTDGRKIFYTEEEIADFKSEATRQGIEINDLKSLTKSIQQMIKKGNPEELEMTVPYTIGMDALEAGRNYNLEQVKAGFYLKNVKVYGIPNTELPEVNYFEIDGTLVPDRTRAFTAEEEIKYTTIFHSIQKKEVNKEVSELDGTLGDPSEF